MIKKIFKISKASNNLGIKSESSQYKIILTLSIDKLETGYYTLGDENHQSDCCYCTHYYISNEIKILKWNYCQV